jgi:uncharacterized membrane protein
VAILSFLALLGCATIPLSAGSDGGAGQDTYGDEGAGSASAASYQIILAPGNATRYVNASTSQKSATYAFQINKTGDLSLPFVDLKLYPWNFPPEEWSYNFIPSAPFEVNPNEPPKTILLVIYPAASAEAKRYTFQLKGMPEGSTNVVTITLEILQYAGVLVKAPPARTADPGETLEFVFEIINTGNGKDRFFIESIEASVTGIQPYLKDNNNWTTDLAPGKSAFKTVVVALPFNLKATKDPAGIQVTTTVRSNFNGSSKDVNWTLLGVARFYGLSLGLSESSVSILPGELAEFSVTILNLGNGNDNVTLNLTSNFDSSGWIINLQKSFFLLPAERSNTTKLKITPPLNALCGSNYTFDILARSSGPPFPETPVERTESLGITIFQVKDIYVPVVDFVAPQAIGPGQVVRFPFNFTNKGNGEDLVNITVLEKPLNWHATLDFFQNIRMQPFVTQEVSLTVQSSINRNESLQQSYNVRIKIANAAKTSIINLTFEIPVGPVYDWMFGVAGNGTVRVNPYLKNACSFALELRNTGNTGAMLVLELSGGTADWASLGTTALALGIGQTASVRLEIRVPRTAEPGSDHLFRVVARSLNEPAFAREVEVSVSVVSLDLAVVPAGQLEIDNFAQKDLRLEAGATIEIGVTVRNDGLDTAPAAGVRFYDNGVLFAEKNTSALRPLRTSVLTVLWASNLSGRHILSVEVDPGNRLGESNRSNNGASCVIEVLAPKVQRGPPPPVNWQAPLSVVAACACAALAFIVYRRRSGVDRELYESIYGKR